MNTTLVAIQAAISCALVVACFSRRKMGHRPIDVISPFRDPRKTSYPRVHDTINHQQPSSLLSFSLFFSFLLFSWFSPTIFLPLLFRTYLLPSAFTYLTLLSLYDFAFTSTNLISAQHFCSSHFYIPRVLCVFDQARKGTVG